jgi:hypothetical protein
MAITQGVKGKGAAGASGAPYNFIIAGLSGATTAGSTWLAWVYAQDTSITVSSFTDDSTGGPMTLTQIGSDVSVTGLKVSLWATAIGGGKGGASFFRCNLSAGARDSVLVLEEWIGPLAFGTSASANNTNADPTLSITTQDANNYIASGFGTVGATLPTAKTGTLDNTQASDGASIIVGAAVFNTSAGAGSVTTAETRVATTWAGIGVELRSVAVATKRNMLLLGVG